MDKELIKLAKAIGSFKVNIKKTSVEFVDTNNLINKTEKRTYKDRFIIILRSRWDMTQSIRWYFAEHGKKGCYLGQMTDADKAAYYDMWDLSKIFPDVRFNDNTQEFNDRKSKLQIIK